MIGTGDRELKHRSGFCKVQSSLALFSYCDVQVQSNPYVLKGDKSVLKRAIVRLLGGGVRLNEYRISKQQGYIG